MSVCVKIWNLFHICDRKYRFEINFCLLMIICLLPSYKYIFLWTRRLQMYKGLLKINNLVQKPQFLLLQTTFSKKMAILLIRFLAQERSFLLKTTSIFFYFSQLVLVYKQYIGVISKKKSLCSF